jgi:hypothetical protein
MKNNARNRRIEQTSSSNLMNQVAPRPSRRPVASSHVAGVVGNNNSAAKTPLVRQRFEPSVVPKPSVSFAPASASASASAFMTRTTSTPILPTQNQQSNQTMYTLPQVIHIVDARLTALETSFGQFSANNISDMGLKLQDTMIELGELREMMAKIEENQDAMSRFVAETMRVLFEKTGCVPDKSILLLGKQVGIQVTIPSSPLSDDTLVSLSSPPLPIIVTATENDA